MVIEGCGAPSTYNLALDSCESEGLVIFMGNIRGDLRIKASDVSQILRRELTIKGVWNSNYQANSRSDWTEALDLLEKETRIHHLITHRVPLKEAKKLLDNLNEVRINHRPHNFLKSILDID